MSLVCATENEKSNVTIVTAVTYFLKPIRQMGVSIFIYFLLVTFYRYISISISIYMSILRYIYT